MATIYWYLFRLDSRKEKMRAFMGDLNNFTPNLKFAYDSGKKKISFLDLYVTQSNGELTDLHIKPTTSLIPASFISSRTY